MDNIIVVKCLADVKKVGITRIDELHLMCGASTENMACADYLLDRGYTAEKIIIENDSDMREFNLPLLTGFKVKALEINGSGYKGLHAFVCESKIEILKISARHSIHAFGPIKNHTLVKFVGNKERFARLHDIAETNRTRFCSKVKSARSV